MQDIYEENTTLNEDEKNYLVKVTNARARFIYGEAHGFGNLLDPRYLGDRMSFEFRADVEEQLIQFGVDYFIENCFDDEDDVDTEELKQTIYKEYTNYKLTLVKERDKNNSLLYMMLKKEMKTVYEFWKTDGSEWPYLQTIALRVFTMACSTASSERNFSTFGFVHSKSRNRLSKECVKKLVYLKSNAFHLAHKKIYFYEDEFENNEMEN